MTEGKRNIIQGLLQEYNIESAADIQEALKDLLGGTIKEMMESEMGEHLGYEKSARSDSDDARNGYKSKRITTSYGGMEIEVPQDRKSTFEPKVVKKRQKDISKIDQKIISMYAKGMTTRQISDTLMDTYGFEASEGFISDVTDMICQLCSNSVFARPQEMASMLNNNTPMMTMGTYSRLPLEPSPSPTSTMAPTR